MMSQDMGEIFEIAHSIAVLNDGALSPYCRCAQDDGRENRAIDGAVRREVQGGRGDRVRDAFS